MIRCGGVEHDTGLLEGGGILEGRRVDISRIEDGIVQTGVEILKCSSRKVRFQSARTGYRRGVDHVAMEDLENMLAKLYD